MRYAQIAWCDRRRSALFFALLVWRRGTSLGCRRDAGDAGAELHDGQADKEKQAHDDPAARFLAGAAATAARRCSQHRAGLTRPSTAGGRVVLYLLAYVAVWTASATIWNLGLAIHFDMAEAFALSREPAVGYFKFSPLINWVTAAWFAVMPTAGWSFYFLAFLNAALGMWFVWLAATFVVDQRRRIAGVALLGLMPVFTLAFRCSITTHFSCRSGRWLR
jgi:hypothetical protein